MQLDPLVLIGLGLLAVVAVVIVLRQRNSGITTVSSVPAQVPQSPKPVAPGASIDELHAEVRQWLVGGNKIEAIKRVRQHTSMGLKEAKDYVEALEAGQAPTLPASPLAPSPGISDDLHDQIRALLAKNQKIEAIKLVRQHTGMGLKEAKDYVEALD
ncbi:MAG: ribosomal protein L7/L12 [Roseiflexaceae bacterium]|nr:ribosomal protein L7/L12 [Roseiflexaceae bacterium]